MSISEMAPKADRVGIAVAAMIFTDLTLSIADAIIKVTISAMPLSQFIFLRSCVTLPLLISILKWRFPQVSLRPAYPGWAIMRSSLLLSSLLIYYASPDLLRLGKGETSRNRPAHIGLLRPSGWSYWGGSTKTTTQRGRGS
ncbi:hypothetical protein [Mesorhizobium sp. ISC15]|uniref:hypothetical protein n=1 Tax=Mesorhizobium sp. ISC15 TaxID=3076429 RepID=UPI00301C1B6F